MSENDVLSRLRVRELKREELLLLATIEENRNEAQTTQLSVGPILEHIWVLGAWLGEELVGAVQMIPSKKEDSVVIFDAVVKENMRNIGIGSRIHQEREKFLRERGRTRTVSAIAPWNGPSLNYSLNKNRTKGVRYHRDCYGRNEDRIEIVKDLLVIEDGFDESGYGRLFVNRGWGTPGRGETLFVPVFTQEIFLNTPSRDTLESLLNERGYIAVGLIRPEFCQAEGNILVLQQKGGDTK